MSAWSLAEPRRVGSLLAVVFSLADRGAMTLDATPIRAIVQLQSDFAALQELQRTHVIAWQDVSRTRKRDANRISELESLVVALRRDVAALQRPSSCKDVGAAEILCGELADLQGGVDELRRAVAEDFAELRASICALQNVDSPPSACEAVPPELLATHLKSSEDLRLLRSRVLSLESSVERLSQTGRLAREAFAVPPTFGACGAAACVGNQKWLVQERDSLATGCSSLSSASSTSSHEAQEAQPLAWHTALTLDASQRSQLSGRATPGFAALGAGGSS